MRILKNLIRIFVVLGACSALEVVYLTQYLVPDRLAGDFLRRIQDAEKRHVEIAGRYASLEDLRQRGYVSDLDDAAKLVLREYAIEITLDKNTYSIVARPRRWTLCRPKCVLEKNSKLVERQ